MIKNSYQQIKSFFAVKIHANKMINGWLRGIYKNEGFFTSLFLTWR